MMSRKNSTVTRFLTMNFCLLGILNLFFYGSLLWGATLESSSAGLEDFYQADKKSDEVADEKEYLLEDLVGTLSINFSEKELMGLKYWIYLDGQIQEAKLSPRRKIESFINKEGYVAVRYKLYKQLEYVLIPGKYLVEIAVESRYIHPSERDENTPFTFSKQEVVIEAGNKTTLNLKVPKITKAFSSSERVSSSPRENYLHDKWPGDITSRLNGYIKDLSTKYERDRLVKGLKNCYYALQYRPPIYQNVYIDLPGEYGGGRYFDAAQVRIIVYFLKKRYSGWPQWLSQRNFLGRNIPERYSKFRDQLALDLDRLYEIAEMLEKVEQ